jgi:16S rRNA C967 or C1407 C5-methylase (RsmB/RsmF family)/NOL1/NOP2/fmu family ribosome biogenesis protein
LQLVIFGKISVLNFPDGFLESLKDVKGFDEIPFINVHESAEQVTSIRINPSKNYKPKTINDKLQNVPWCDTGYYLESRPSFTMDPLFHGGAYYVQEASSMFLWHALKNVTDVNAKLRIIDVCAAPGGKSSLLTSLFPNSLLISNEVIKSRAAILVENITKWGSENVVVTNNDPSAFTKLEGYADIIVVDAPCSGSGLFRKDPSAAEEWSIDNVQMCAKRQHRILEDVIPALKENGLLVYATCSYSKDEDEQIMQWLVESQQMENIPLTIPAEWNIVETKIENAVGYRFFPDKIKGEGFFIALFRKTTATNESFPYGKLNKCSKAESEIISEWVLNADKKCFFKQSADFLSIGAEWESDISFLQQNLYLKHAGIQLGTIKGKDFIPAHNLAVSSIVNKKSVNVVELNLDEALKLLKKQNIEVQSDVKGWALASYNNVNLGWLKILPNRINNYYPVEWRILKD